MEHVVGYFEIKSWRLPGRIKEKQKRKAVSLLAEG
jgi:hypothetical protein